MDYPILAPVFVQVALTFVVFWIMGGLRVSEALRKSDVREAVKSGQKDVYSRSATLASDNLRNQFEMPVLFYVGVVVAFMTDTATPLQLNLAWAFVAFRILHAIIHCTVNIVNLRFLAFFFSNVALAVFWITLARKVLL